MNSDGNLEDAFYFSDRDQKAKKISIDVTNYKNLKICDNISEIENFFAHEGTHYNDFKELGYNAYKLLHILNNSKQNDFLENHAVKAQMEHPSWGKVRDALKNEIMDYGKILPKISAKPIKTLK